jgi:3-oxoacyl-[acyl-carrier protein] reductase
MDLQLKGLKALVTGASRGLGYATALQLAHEGVHVAINSRTPENIQAAAARIVKETRSKVLPIPGDLSLPEFAATLVKQAADTLGGLDILITNAGGPPSGAFEAFDDSTWQKAFDLSMMSHVRLIRAALLYLRESRHAAVLTCTSYSVKQPIPNLILSNSIRAAVIGLTKTLSIELGSDNIRFNSILPGWTETERIYEIMRYRAQLNSTSIEDEIQKQIKENPMRRMGKPEEFANAAVFLVSPAASYINGIMLTVDGGLTRGTL